MYIAKDLYSSCIQSYAPFTSKPDIFLSTCEEMVMGLQILENLVSLITGETTSPEIINNGDFITVKLYLALKMISMEFHQSHFFVPSDGDSF